MTQPAPEIGMGGTYGICGDAYPVTVRRISKSGHMIWAAHDDARVVKGSAHDGSAEWECTPVPNAAATVVFTRRKDGSYKMRGCTSYGTLYLGVRRRREDPHR